MSNHKTAIVGCHGFSSRTGKRVGSRHRWNGGGTCEWCSRYKDQVFKVQETVAERRARAAGVKIVAAKGGR